MFRVASGIIIILSLLLPPYLAVWLAGHELSLYLNFPFITPPAQHEAFSWSVWWLMVIFVFVVSLPFLVHALRVTIKIKPSQKDYYFPVWGIVAFILLIVFWILAWNRFTWFASLQVYTFTPLWLCYIVIVNAITTYRKGHCLLVKQPSYLLGLFILSSIFWWYYEYLNGFIKNWYYVGIDQLTTTEYVFHSTLAYATVLPAVISTIELLNTLPRLNQPFTKFRAWQLPNPKAWAIANWIGGCVVLGMAVTYPEQLFMLVWIAPLFIIVGARTMLGQPTLYSSLAKRDWRSVVLPATAALICGFFWELWNSQSFAHWQYNIPYVDRFLLFEMPAIGYAGYLPFGLVCLAIAELLPDTDRLFR
ncbi:MAG: hypothetical protein IIB73_00695 [Proteobacteria bacterium]|nr:hypothetical protein [Pseudomonadota bacterium]